MPTLDIQAAKAAGYSDAEINEFVKNAGATHLTSGSAGSYSATDPTNGMSPSQMWAAGAGRAVVHAGRSIGNLVGLVPDSSLVNEKEIDAPLMSQPAGQAGNLMGEAAMTAPIAMGASAGVGSLGRAGAAIAANPISNAALQGGIQGLVTSDPGSRVFNTATGALTGGALAGVGGVVGKLARGLKQTPDAQLLVSRGIDLTPGQLNPGGVANQFEQAAESIPGVKQIVHGARENAEQQYQARVIQAGAAPGATIRPSENIHDMLQQAYDSYAPLYDQAKGFPVSPTIMRTTGPDIPLSAAFQNAAKTPGTTKAAQNAAGSWLGNALTSLPKNPDSSDLLAVRSSIRQAARKARLSTDTIAQDKAAIFDKADQHVTSALQSQLPPDAMSALQSADSAYGNYKVVENAVAKSKDNLAGLTPQKLSQAIYDATADPAYARGAGGDLRDLAKAGTSVFQTVSPPTGARVATLGAGLAGAMGAPHVAIPVATGMLGLTGTQTGRRLAAGITAPQLAAQRLAAGLKGNIPPYLRAPTQQLLTRGAVGAGMPLVPGALGGASALAAGLLPQKPQ